MKSLVESWDKYMADNHVAINRVKYREPKDFDQAMKTAIYQAIVVLRREAPDLTKDVRSEGDLERILNAASYYVSKDGRDAGAYLKLTSGYAQMYSAYQEIRDQRSQHNWAHFWENARILLFRILTAVGIAAVVLGTYAIADGLGIPMPLRMPV